MSIAYAYMYSLTVLVCMCIHMCTYTICVLILYVLARSTPVRTIFEPHKYGVVAIALSPDAKFLATLSAPNPAASTPQPQTFAIWDWTTGSEEPLCSAVLPPEYGIQVYSYESQASIYCM